MSEFREGPKTTVTRSCAGCVYLHSRYYACQGDSGFDYYCIASPHGVAGQRAVSSALRTPSWCPFLGSETEKVERDDAVDDGA